MKNAKNFSAWSHREDRKMPNFFAGKLLPRTKLMPMIHSVLQNPDTLLKPDSVHNCKQEKPVKSISIPASPGEKSMHDIKTGLLAGSPPHSGLREHLASKGRQGKVEFRERDWLCIPYVIR